MADQVQGRQRHYMRFRGIETLDTQSDRVGMDPTHASWLENLQPVAPNQLLTVPGPAPAVATISVGAGVTIARIFDATFSANGGIDSTFVVDWAVCFMTDGSAFVVNIAGGTITQFANAGTFSQRPDCTQWKSERILIADFTSGYCTYDNSTFVQQGGVSPNFQVTAAGTGYTSSATVTISGGTGSGATATPVIVAGSLSKIVLTNPGSGYVAGDTITVTVNAVGGGSGATANGHVWPFGGITGFTLSPAIAIVNPGSYYYPAPPTVTIAPSHGTRAVANVINGQVVSISITSVGGTWLVSDVPSITLSAPPASVTASGTAVFHPAIGWTVTLANGGFGYTIPPTITASGGSGSGAQFTSSYMTNSAVGGVANTALGTGYVDGDVVTLTFGPPPAAVTATATAQLLKTNNTTSTIAVFQGRVWLGGLRLLQWTGVGSVTFGQAYDDFNPATASGSLVIADSDLVHSIQALRNLNNYLYIFGDQSIKFIGSISVSGTVTNFSILTLASDQGCTFPMTIQSYNRFVFFTNQIGVWAVYGATLQKVSDFMDGIFRHMNFGIDLQAAVVDINDQHVYLLLVHAVDYKGVLRKFFLGFQTKRWFAMSNLNNETAMAMITVGPQRQLFATSGVDITQLAARPTQAVAFVLQTALSDDRKPEQGKRGLRAGAAQRTPDAVSQTITTLTESEQNNTSFSYALNAPYLWGQAQANCSGQYLGVTMSGAVSNYEIIGVNLEYEETVLMKSSNLVN